MKIMTFILFACIFFSYTVFPRSPSTEVENMVKYKAPPVFEKIHGVSGEYRGHLSGRLDAITDGWLIPAPLANPAMIGMFLTRERERDSVKLPWTDDISGDVLPWSGEFVGKHLLSSHVFGELPSQYVT